MQTYLKSNDMSNELNTKQSFEINAANGLDAETVLAAIKNKPTDLGAEVKRLSTVSKKEEPLTLSKLQLAEIIEAQVRKHLDRFKEDYNKINSERGKHIDYRIAVRESRADEGNKIVQAIEVSLIIDGEAILICRKAYGFTHEAQVSNEGEWKLTLWNETLFNLIGGGIAYAMTIASERKHTN
jgi:hypothetical protein